MERGVRGTQPRNYDAEILRELPNTSDPVYEFPGPLAISTGSMLMRVRPSGLRSWIGVFYETWTQHATANRRGLFATPRADVIAVMAGLSVWWVNVRDPSERFSPDLSYIEDAIFDAERDQMIVSQFFKVEAFGPEGLRWAIRGPDFDGIQLSEPDGYVMRASGDSICALPACPFAFDLRTGQPLEGPIERTFGRS